MKKSRKIVIMLLTCILVGSCLNGCKGNSNNSSLGYETSSKLKRLEPKGEKILHGAGQDMGAFYLYCNALSEDTQPIISMYYTGLRDNLSDFFKGIKSDLYDYGDDVIPQIGLSMTVDGSPEMAFDYDVAQGEADAYIEILVNELKALDRPVFLRIGYEFNGEWNGYQPETYRQAFIKITDAIRNANLEDVATVWCYSPDAANTDYMSFYPGDEYVDWWAIDIFELSKTNSADSLQFLEDAKSKKYPVMLGEVTSRYVGVDDGTQSWNDFYGPFFKWVDDHKEIKALCYINWDWSKYANWSDWGNAQIQENDIVFEKYQKEMLKGKYIHSQGSNN